MVQAERVEKHQDTVYWVDIKLAQKKGFKLYQTRSNAVIFHDTLPAYIVSRKLLWWNLEKSHTRKYMYHLDHHRRFLSKVIGWKNWIQKSLEAAKTPNESNQNQKPNYQERWDPWVDKNPPRRSRKMSCLVTRTSSTRQDREEPWVDRNLSKIACRCLQKLKKTIKNGETRRWTRVHQNGGARHWFQSARTVTLRCEGSRTFPSSTARQKDRKSSSSRSTSSRLAAE